MIITDKKLSIIMPAYNEGEHIYDNLIKASEVVSGFIDNFEIVVVNDGSRDDTYDEIKRAKHKDAHICPVSYRTNKGKGNAIKRGVERATGDVIAFLDADLDLPPDQLEAYVSQILDGEAEVVIGSKMHPDSKIEYPAIRKFMSFGYYCMLKVLFRLDVRDTQTGIKAFEATSLKAVMPLVKTRGYAYDIELLIGLNERGCRICEMPVRLEFHRKSGLGRIRLKDIIKVFRDTLNVYNRYLKGGYKS